MKRLGIGLLIVLFVGMLGTAKTDIFDSITVGGTASFTGTMAFTGTTISFSPTTSFGAYSPAIYLGYDAGARVNIAVTDTTGAVAVTHTGSGATLGWTVPAATWTNATSNYTYTPDWRIGYDSGAYLNVAVADNTGDTTITMAGSNKGVAWTAAGGFTFTGAFTITGAVGITSGTITGITDLAVADGGTGASNAATARTNLGLAIGTNVQAYDAELAAIAALTYADDQIILGTGAGTIAMASCTTFAQGILDDADEATFKATVNLEIGTDVQAYDAELAALAGLTFADDKIILGTGAGTVGTADCTTFAQSILDDANEATFKATVNLEPGTDVQGYDADLTTYAGITPTATAQVALGYANNSVVLSHRHRVTAAEINSGHELLPAIVGKSYRLIECKAIAYGGAVITTTTVDLLGTQGTSSVKLVAYAQASLVQSAVLYEGLTGAAVLADGASYAACDANTAITVGKTGGDVGGATGVDFILTYVIE